MGRTMPRAPRRRLPSHPPRVCCTPAAWAFHASFNQSATRHGGCTALPPLLSKLIDFPKLPRTMSFCCTATNHFQPLRRADFVHLEPSRTRRLTLWSSDEHAYPPTIDRRTASQPAIVLRLHEPGVRKLREAGRTESASRQSI